MHRKWMVKFLAACLIVFAGIAIIYSAVDAETWVANDSISTPLSTATHYVANGLRSNDSLLIVCPVNNLNINVVKFYLNADESKNNTVWDYPTLPPDSYTPDFNITELSSLCQQKTVKYLLLDENLGYGYFNSTLTAQAVYNILAENNNFSYQTTLGNAPYRIFIFKANPS